MVKITVDNDACIGCGACTAQCADMFEMKEVDGSQKAVVKQAEVEDAGCANDAVEICPVDAIKVE